MKCKPVQWMGILVLIVIFGGCASTAKTNVDSQVVVQESLQQLIDQQEILEIISQYSYSWDNKQPDKLAAIFTDDASWEWWPPGAKKAKVIHTPRKTFRDWAAERFRTNLADRQTRHYQTNTEFLEMTNNVARTRTIILVIQSINGQKGPKIPAHSGTYEDEFRKTPDGWRISRRILRTDG